MEGGEFQMKKEKDSFTIECLRRRLLAERLESKAALDDVQRLQRKVLELERRLEGEIELARKADKAFRCAIKKLEYLNLLSFEFEIIAKTREIANNATMRRSWSKADSCKLLEEGQKGEDAIRKELTLKGGEDNNPVRTEMVCLDPSTSELCHYTHIHDIAVVEKKPIGRERIMISS